MTIDHPDLPDALKQIAAEAVQTIWQLANEAATGELAALRAEARDAASAAEVLSARRTQPRRPGSKRAGPNSRRAGTSWTPCAPNSRPSWSGPARR